MKYVMIISGIVGMGGGQKYCSNKVETLKKMGHTPIVVSAFSGEVMLASLKEYGGNIIPELRYSPLCFANKYRNNILKKIEGIVGEMGEDTIIDSSSVTYAEWGELLAKRNNCEHICFFIDEEFDINKDESAFLKFKHDRKELYGTSKETLTRLFSNYYSIAEEERYTFIPYCVNVVEDINNPYDGKINNGGINIGIIGRLDKPYVKAVIQDLSEFFKSQNHERINLIIIGGTDKKSVEADIKEIVSQIDGINVVMTGYLNPIPRKLLKSFNICIASAGSAVVSVNEGITTVYVNALNGHYVGVIGYTVEFGDYDLRYGECSDENLSGILDKILYKGFCEKGNKKIEKCVIEGEKELIDEISWQLSMANQKRDRVYYDINSIRINKKYKIIRAMIACLGVRVTDWLILEAWHFVSKG